MVIGLVNAIFFYEEVRMSYDYNKLVLAVTDGIMNLWMEPIHHVVLFAAVVKRKVKSEASEYLDLGMRER